MDTLSFNLQLAAQMFTRHGKAAIWKLHVAAAERYRAGDAGAAATLVETAEILESRWLDETRLIQA